MPLSKTLLDVLLVWQFASVSAFWRLLCDNAVTVGRYDPIVSPGAIAGHVHTIAGGSGFGMSTSYEAMRNASCTSCQVTQDLSNYWVPSLYYQNPNNGSFEDVKTIGGMTVYYLQRGDNPRAFPPGFRMLAGNPNLRSYANTLEQGAVNYVCLDYSAGTTASDGLPTKNCPQGLRAQLVLPSCWSGKELDAPDHKSHMAYPSGVSTGDCPAGFPIRLVTIFFEVTFIVDDFASRWYADRPQPFVLANGDPTGYGFHGDFVNGWDEKFLQSAVDTCTAASGLQEDCPLFNLSRGQQCHITPQVNEVVTGSLAKLPGCNPVQFGPAPATPQQCQNQTIPQVWNDTAQYKGATAPPNSHFLANQPQTVQNYSSWTYAGCWSDSNSRVLPSKVGTAGALNVENCLDACNSAGYAFGGMEAGAECWCGNVAPSTAGSTPLTYASCSSTCPGNSLELCGGSWALSVYNNSAIIPPSIPATSKDGTAKYLGCFQDGSSRIMEYSAGNTNSTVDGCVAACKARGYPFSGVEYMGECYCSANSPVSNPKMADSECSMKCTGDATQYCGAGYRLQAYQAAIAKPSSTSSISSTPSVPTPAQTSKSTAVVSTAYAMPYAGCFSDQDPRSLSHKVTFNNTIEGCISACSQAGYKIAGLEYGSECWCDAVVNLKMTKTPESDCNMPCTGNKAQLCGAGNRLSIYNSTALTQAKIQPTSNGLSYVGCYTDDGSRVMSRVGSANSTVNACTSACLKSGYTQAGLEYGGECYCGTLAARSVNVPDTDCSMACNDDTSTLCGAGNRLAVYAAGSVQAVSSSSSSSSSTVKGRPTAQVLSSSSVKPSAQGFAASTTSTSSSSSSSTKTTSSKSSSSTSSTTSSSLSSSTKSSSTSTSASAVKARPAVASKA